MSLRKCHRGNQSQEKLWLTRIVMLIVKVLLIASRGDGCGAWEPSGSRNVEHLAWNTVSTQQMLHLSFPSHAPLYNDRICICICLPAMRETWVQSLGWEDPLEKGMATHSNILAWRIPWTEESGGLQFMGSQRVGHDWMTNTFTFHFVRISYFFSYPLGIERK